jgi:hypothetical protein
MADPELSLQSILIFSVIIGRRKTWTYVAWVALFSTLAGSLYGAWVDGASAWLIAGYVAAFVGLLAAGLWLVGSRAARKGSLKAVSSADLPVASRADPPALRS